MNQGIRARHRRPPRIRRGTVYLTVLGAASLLTVLGLSAMTLVRIQQRIHRGQLDTVKARFASQSLTDVVLRRLSASANWRTTHVNDTWTSPESAGEITFRYKLVDEIDGSLGNDPSQPVRVYVNGQCGNTVRIQSVSVKPAAGVSSLVRNGNMELNDNGVPADWSRSSGGTLTWRVGDPNTGVALALLSNRSSASSGVRQSLPLTLQSGASYTLEAYLKSGLLTSGRISLVIEGSSSGTQAYAVTGAMLLNLWTRISGTVTPTWKGSLREAYIVVNTTAGTSDLRVDDVSMTLSGNAAMLAQPGTWRREILP